MSDSGVYVIKNLVNGKPYFGSTGDSFNFRFITHRSELRNNHHFNQHLQNAWNKYGESSFKMHPIIYCDNDNDKSIEYEQRILDYLFDNYEYSEFYNMSRKADRPPIKSGSEHPSWQGGKVELECEECGESFKVFESEVKDRKFCSMKCKGRAMPAGRNHPKWQEKTEINCKQCGETFKVTDCRVGKAKFCSRKCSYNYASEEDLYSEENNPRWGGGKIELNCKNCGDTFKRKPSQEDRSKFCSRSCQGKYQGKGEKNGSAKLTEDDVIEIKKLFNENKYTQKEIADMFGVSRGCVKAIKYGNTWTHISLEG